MSSVSVLRILCAAGGLAAGLAACSATSPAPIPDAESAKRDAAAAPFELEAAPARIKNKEMAQLQQALNKNGAALKVDGIFGPQTRSALRRFQHNNNLRITGKADAPTRAKLGL